ncbi:MAG: ribosome assembly cofactor RimP [Chlorobi bacterium]|nr:ribosome assembly cofactor RimP [Chlorobiota bacterium]
MITVKQIEDLILDKLEEDGVFVVEIDVSPANKISVTLDSEKGIPISYCVDISRLIEHSLDRDKEDFALEVSTAGLDQPLKMPRQFKKNVGRNVDVVTNDDEKLTGKLVKADDAGFVVETEQKVRVDGKKKKELVVTAHEFKFDQVKSVKIVVSFK